LVQAEEGGFKAFEAGTLKKLDIDWQLFRDELETIDLGDLGRRMKELGWREPPPSS
jgi:hypothetical protein